MELTLPFDIATAYKSRSQRARVITESWARENLFCPACPADRLGATAANTKAVDFECSACGQQFQLKAKSSSFSNRVIDGAYDAMVTALKSDTAPNLCLMHYDQQCWRAINLLIIPHFAFPPSAILRRRPLSSTARRAGWVGCFIALEHVPADAKISMIRDGVVSPLEKVREQFRRLAPLQSLTLTDRGWTLDVLNEVRRLGKIEFTNSEIYERAQYLAAIHPENRHIRDKIRQQLQFLRDSGFLMHIERARWRLRHTAAPHPE